MMALEELERYDMGKEVISSGICQSRNVSTDGFARNFEMSSMQPVDYL